MARNGQQPVEATRGVGRRWPMALIRYVLPGAVVVAGVVVMALGGNANVEGGAAILSAGVAIFILNWLLRLGASGQSERDAEDAAREYFTQHGHWPGG